MIVSSTRFLLMGVAGTKWRSPIPKKLSATAF